MENQRVLRMELIGFCSNRSTLNHCVILAHLAEKYINSGGRKLFTAFLYLKAHRGQGPSQILAYQSDFVIFFCFSCNHSRKLGGLKSVRSFSQASRLLNLFETCSFCVCAGNQAVKRARSGLLWPTGRTV